MEKSYLLALEIDAVELEQSYTKLPLHCTLMLWFTSTLPTASLADRISHIAALAPSLAIRVANEAIYGPPYVIVSEIELSSQLKTLHMELFNILENLQVKFDKPQFVGKVYSPHISHQNNGSHVLSDILKCDSIFLASTSGSKHKGARRIIAKYLLRNTQKLKPL